MTTRLEWLRFSVVVHQVTSRYIKLDDKKPFGCSPSHKLKKDLMLEEAERFRRRTPKFSRTFPGKLSDCSDPVDALTLKIIHQTAKGWGISNQIHPNNCVLVQSGPENN